MMIKLNNRLKAFLIGASFSLLLAACDEAKVTSGANEQENLVPGSEFTLTSEGGKVLWPVFKVEEGKEIPQEGYLWTNIANTSPEDDVIAFPHRVPFYNIAKVGYSQEFASAYGFPEKLVMEFSPGIHVLEFRMKTEDARTWCYLNMLLDKNQGLYFPDEPFHDYLIGDGLFWWSAPLHFPYVPKDAEFRKAFENKRKEIMGPEESAKWQAEKLRERKLVTRSIFLASDYNPEKKISGGHLSLYLREFHPTLYPGYDYISVDIGCGEFVANFFEGLKPQIWIKKKIAADYGKVLKLNPDDFLKLDLPRNFVTTITPVLKTYNSDTLTPDKRLINEYYYPENQLGLAYYRWFDDRKKK